MAPKGRGEATEFCFPHYSAARVRFIIEGCTKEKRRHCE